MKIVFDESAVRLICCMYQRSDPYSGDLLAGEPGSAASVDQRLQHCHRGRQGRA